MTKNKLFSRGIFVSLFILISFSLIPQRADASFFDWFFNFFRFNAIVNERSAENVAKQPATALSATLDEGLIAYYKLDEGSGATVADSSGSRNSGILNGSASWVAGKINNALSFSATSSSVSLSKVLPSFTEFTASAWVKVNDLNVARGVFASGSQGQNLKGFRFRINMNGSVRLFMAGAGVYDYLETNAGIIQPGVFYHITVIGKSGQYMKIYVNGALASAKNTNQTIDAPTSAGYIGSSWNSNMEFMHGVIDELRVYDRTLSNEEISSLLVQDYELLSQSSLSQNTPSQHNNHTLVNGPMAGGVTNSSAKVWFRVKPEGNVQIKYSSDSSFNRNYLISQTTRTLANNDYTGSIELSNLKEDTIYYYKVLVDGEDQTTAIQPKFKTFPVNADSVKFGILTDIDTNPLVSAASIQSLANDNPDFVLVLGDWDHRDVSNLTEMRIQHQETRGDEKVAGKQFRDYILYNFPVDHVWDDHDYGGNNSNKTFKNRDQAIQAYDEYWPSYDRPNPKAGIWHKFKYGNLAEVFMLDLRSQKDLGTYMDPRFVPDDKQGANRMDIRNDHDRSMLDGDEYPEGNLKGQKQWLKNSLKNSTAKWKIIASTVPWNPTTPKDDAWWDFKAEQDELLKFIADNKITGVMIVSGDIHTGGAIDNGTNSGIPEMNVAAVNMPSPDTTCAIHRPVQELGCGKWSEGYIGGGSGYGLIRLSPIAASIEAKNAKGDVKFNLTLPYNPRNSSSSSFGSLGQDFFNFIYNRSSDGDVGNFILTKVNINNRDTEDFVKMTDTSTFGDAYPYYFKLNNGDDAIVYSGYIDMTDTSNKGSGIYFKNLTTGMESKVAEAPAGFKDIQPKAIEKKDGTILVAFTVSSLIPKSSESNIFPYVMIKQSEDNGNKWKLNTSKGLFAKYYSPYLVELKDGSVGLLASWFNAKNIGGGAVDSRSLHFYKSSNGSVWSLESKKIIYEGPDGNDINQSSAIQSNKGKIIVATRVRELKEKGNNRIIVSFSDDNGLTWSNPKIILDEKYPAKYQVPVLRKIKNTLVLSYKKFDRVNKFTKRGSVISLNGGENWEKEVTIDDSKLNLGISDFSDRDDLE